MKYKIKNRYVPSEPMNSTDHLDLTKAVKMTFPNLKPTSTAISLRLPNFTLNRLKVLANKRHVPYQSLLKVLLAQALEKELRHAA